MQLRPMPHYARSVAASRVSEELSYLDRSRYTNVQGHKYIMKITRDQGLLWPDTQLVLVVVSQRGRSTRGGTHGGGRGHHGEHETSVRCTSLFVSFFSF